MTVLCDYPYLVVTFLMFFITRLCKFLSGRCMPELRVVTTQQQKYGFTGSIYQVLATLAVLAEGLLTQESFQTPSQAFSEWMTKPVLTV